MDHIVRVGGQDAFCQKCGKTWALDETPPACEPPRQSGPQQSPLVAFLVGPRSPGANPSLVFAYDPASAKAAMTTASGIHKDDLHAVRSPQVDDYAESIWYPCPALFPDSLTAAWCRCGALITEHFPGATSIRNPFKPSTRK